MALLSVYLLSLVTDRDTLSYMMVLFSLLLSPLGIRINLKLIISCVLTLASIPL